MLAWWGYTRSAEIARINRLLFIMLNREGSMLETDADVDCIIDIIENKLLNSIMSNVNHVPGCSYSQPATIHPSA